MANDDMYSRVVAGDDETRAIYKNSLILRGMSEEEAEAECNKPLPPERPLTNEELMQTQRRLEERAAARRKL